MNKYEINVSYGEEDLNKLLINIIVNEIRKYYEL